MASTKKAKPVTALKTPRAAKKATAAKPGGTAGRPKASPRPKAAPAGAKKRARTAAGVESAGAETYVSPVTGRPIRNLRGEQTAIYRKLVEMRDQILDGIDFLAGDNLNRSQRESSGDLSGYSIHMADVGTDNFDREFALSLASTERRMLYEIEEAIRRLEAGGFGACERCSVKIPMARLRALPSARYCVPCQEEAEKRMRLGLPPFLDHEDDHDEAEVSFAEEGDFEEDDPVDALPETESSVEDDD